jgi:hypothetical protein
MRYAKTQLIPFTLCTAALFCCHGDKKNSTEPEAKPFVIENLGVTFGAYDEQTGCAGDFVFSKDWQKVFVEFGAPVLDPEGNIKELPHFTYIVKEDAGVLSICDGKVGNIYYQEESKDYEFFVRSTSDPSYEVYYDHVVDLLIKEEDRVQVGDVLAHPRFFYSGLGSFEVMINNTDTKRSYCPFNFLSEEKFEEYRLKVERLIREWEEFKGDSTIYDEKNYPLPGCRYESMLSY